MNKLWYYFHKIMPIYEEKYSNRIDEYQSNNDKRIAFFMCFAESCGDTTYSDNQWDDIFYISQENMNIYFMAKKGAKHDAFWGKRVSRQFLKFFSNKDYVNNLTKYFERYFKLLAENKKQKFDWCIDQWKHDELFAAVVNQINDTPEQFAIVLAKLFSNLLREKAGRINTSLKVCDSDYFCADIMYDGQIISGNECISEFIIEKRHLIISGEGGLGKTTFLKSLKSNSYFCNRFSAVLYLPLIGLAQSKPIDPGVNENRFAKIESSYICRELKNGSSLSPEYFNGFFEKERKLPYLLLLDGLNELYDGCDSVRTKDILNEIKFLSEKTEICIVLTTRSVDFNFLGLVVYPFVKISITGTPENNISEYRARGCSKETLELVQIPMYYFLFRNLDKSGHNLLKTNKYSLLGSTWKQLFLQSTYASDFIKQALYFCFAPELAQYMINNRKGLEILKSEAVALFESMLNNKKKLAVLLDVGGCSIRTDIWYDGYRIVTMLQNENIISKGDSIKFIHQDWCEFLAAFSLENKFNLIVSRYNNDIFKAEDIPEFNLNVPNTVMEMFLQAQNIPHDLNGKCKALFEKLMSIIEEIDMTMLKATADECDIIFVEMLCQFVECIPSSASNVYFDKVKKQLSHIISHFFFMIVNNNITIHSERTKQLLINIITKQSEYLRARTYYKTALQYVAYGMEKLDANSMKLLNQKGKVYLYYAQSRYLKEDIVEPLDVAEEDAAFEKGMNIIRVNASKHNNMSSNLLALNESLPAPYVKKNHLVETNYIKAFWTYFDVINGEYSGKELVYSLRQCAALLIKGYVMVDEASPMILNIKRMTGHLPRTDVGAFKDELSKLRECVRECVDDNDLPCFFPEELNHSTIMLAESIIEMIRYETNDTYVLFLIGCIELAKGNREVAKTFLRKTNNLQAKIILFSTFNEGTEETCLKEYIAKQEEANNDEFGRIDKCHLCYQIIEAKQLMKRYNICLKGNI